MIRCAVPGDAVQICAIYNPYIVDSTITFEETLVSIEEMAQRIRDVSKQGRWLVDERGGRIVGYAYATPWRVRSAYRFSVESTVYVAPDAARQGVARGLYEALLAALQEDGIHAVIGGIAQPNLASVALHERLGFEKIAHFKEVGQKFGKWIDVGYWQRIFR